MPDNLHASMATVQIDEQTILQLYDHLPDAIAWYFPLFSENGDVVDFEIRYCNKALGNNLNIPIEDLTGSLLSGTKYTDSSNAVQIFTQCKQVYLTGKPFEVSYYSPIYDQFFHVSCIKVMDGVLNVIRNRTHEWKLELEKQQQATLVNQIIDASPTCVVLCQAVYNNKKEVQDFTILSVNEKIAADLKMPKSRIEGMLYGTLHPGIYTNGYFAMLKDVVTTGQPFRGEMYLEIFGGWFFVSADKVDPHNVVVICLDINESKKAAAELEKLTGQLQGILDSSLTGVCSLQAVRDASGKITDFIYEKVNRRFEQLVGRTADEVEGKTYLALYPHAMESGFFAQMCDVVETGQSKRTEVEYHADGLNGWYESSISPMGRHGIVVSFADITETKRVQLELESQRNLLDSILRHSPAGISVTKMLRNSEGVIVDCISVLANDISERFTGIPKDVSLTKKGSEIIPGFTGSPLFAQALETLRTGHPFNTQYYLEPTRRWLELSVSKMDADHLINVFTDITASKEAQLAVERSADNLQKVIDAAQTGMFTFRPHYDATGQIVDFYFDIVNIAVAAYVNEVPENMKGKLGTAFFPNYKATGVFDMYRKTFETGATLRQEFHYNVDGIDAYLDIQSTKIEDMVLVTFTDHTPIRQAQIQLERLVEELRRSNVNLEEFAYAASHDLKEPIRKIHFFSDRLLQQYGHLFDDEGRKLFERLTTSTDRMRTLVEDLLSYSQVSVRPKVFDDVDLNMVLKIVSSDLELEIEEKGGSVLYQSLPVVQGHQRQLQQLFQNLIGNGLKYSRKDTPPVIQIRCTAVKGHEAGMNLRYEDRRTPYYLIEVQDNGIGFDQRDAERIFQVFQRLHGNSEYRGTGVGLSIARKVAENHKGYIEAVSETGKGATFKILLPA